MCCPCGDSIHCPNCYPEFNRDDWEYEQAYADWVAEKREKDWEEESKRDQAERFAAMCDRADEAKKRMRGE